MENRDRAELDAAEEADRGLAFRLLAWSLPLLVLGACAAVVVLVLRGGRDDGGDEDAGWSGGDGAVGEGPPDPVPDLSAEPDPEAALESMRQRYRPGPFVRVVGLLPSSRVQDGSISWLRRRGRTIDNPWLVRGGELRPTRAPSATTGRDRPALAHALGEAPSQALSIVAGVPNQMRVQLGHPVPGREVAGLHVAFGSYLGHFWVPVDSLARDGEVGAISAGEADLSTVDLVLDAAVMPDGRPLPPGVPFPVTMYIGAADSEGNVSDYLLRELHVVPVGTGDVEVTLTMSQATDLDLYVIEPTGVAVYYGNTRSLSGGQLDLDANAACSRNMGVNNEHVFWPAGQAPSGVYTVRVASYASCIGGGPVDYQVTVRSCGETAVLAGSFSGPGNRAPCTSPPGMDASWCHDVVTFAVTPCAGRYLQ